MFYKNLKFAFFADCKERKCIFNLDRNPVNRVKLFMDIRYIEV